MKPLPFETVRLFDDGRLCILDQRMLPGREEYIELQTAEDVWHAIKDLAVRGAPLIGVAAAYGFYISVKDIDDDFLAGCRKVRDYLDSSRPTAVNLSWALDRMMRVAEAGGPDVKVRLLAEARAIHREDISMTELMGRHGYGLIGPSTGILTHCNAGALATSGYGTALAPVYAALDAGRTDLRVYCDETRPLLQGARLSAFEMGKAGADTTVLTDSMASYAMASGLIDLVFVGADRIAANGDTANKIGTSGVAILAKHYGIPFYVVAPTSTVDLSLPSGKDIPIEQRPPEEVTEKWYRERMAPEGVKVLNPAFDVTPSGLISAIVTEKGVIRPPFREGLQGIIDG